MVQKVGLGGAWRSGLIKWHILWNGGCKGVEEELVGRMVQKVGPWTRVWCCRGSWEAEEMTNKMVHEVGHRTRVCCVARVAGRWRRC